MNTFFDFLIAFIFYYPLFMAYLWMIGGVYYRFHWEDKEGKTHLESPEMKEHPPVSILIPCYNEADNLHEVLYHLDLIEYPDYEIVAINDCSTDNTGELLDELSKQYAQLRVIHLNENHGKATALQMGALLTKNEYLVCVDGDSLLEPHAVSWLVKHLYNSPRVGAVTGNPRIRNRSTLLGKLQVGEFSSIIGLIKRAQRIYGRVFTVSGVVAAFRKTALHDIGYWNNDMATEDIDVSWRLQINTWGVHYEPNAVCWILMPETLQGLWDQRLRWAKGGAETAKRHISALFSWKKRRMWPVLLEYTTSVFWSYSVLFALILWAINKFHTLPAPFHVASILPNWAGVILGMTCLLQFAITLWIDSRYEKRLLSYLFWIVWYPLIYWMINVFTAVVGVPQGLLQKKGKRAVWESPDRGIK